MLRGRKRYQCLLKGRDWKRGPRPYAAIRDALAGPATSARPWTWTP
jgi:hypothetical protein